MKDFRSAFAALLALTALPLTARVADAAPPQTRAAHIGVMAAGVGTSMHMEDYLRDNPRSRTAILTYVKFDTMDMGELVQSLHIHADIQERAEHEFWPQIAVETGELNLASFRQELAHPGSHVERSVRLLAHEIAQYRSRNKWFFIRPFSEMNDATPSCPWEFGIKERHNTPQDLAAAWKLLRDTFDQEGATNAIFVFSPLAAYRVHQEDQVLAAMNLIPPGYIDAFGLNVYSRPMTAYGGKSAKPIPFSELAQPWIKVLARSRHHGIPLAVAEMGVSNQANDFNRARWLREAFAYSRSHHFILVTYFNFPHPYYHIDNQTLAGEALRIEINLF